MMIIFSIKGKNYFKDNLIIGGNYMITRKKGYNNCVFYKIQL
jgi:hypothetical protein